MKRIGLLLGVGLLLFGGFLLWTEMQKPAAHSPHVYLFAGMMALGTLLIAPAAIGQGLTIVVNAAATLLPVWPGGRRSYDPPAPTTPPAVTPAPAPTLDVNERGDETGG